MMSDNESWRQYGIGGYGRPHYMDGRLVDIEMLTLEHMQSLEAAAQRVKELEEALREIQRYVNAHEQSHYGESIDEIAASALQALSQLQGAADA